MEYSVFAFNHKGFNYLLEKNQMNTWSLFTIFGDQRCLVSNFFSADEAMDWVNGLAVA